jgi:23S rRNA (cytosine1962-C5)-methyltransferase
MVHAPSAPLSPGTLVDVHDREDLFVGRAFFNPRSQIALRVLTTDPDEAVDDRFFRDRVRAAVELRHDVLKLPGVTDAYRLIHGEGDGLSGLVVDRLGAVLAVDVRSIGFFARLAPLSAWLGEHFPGARIRATADEDIQKIEGFRLGPPGAVEGVTVREHGVEFRVDFESGHKTGFFCDQRENRRETGKLAAGRDFLDLATYTGGFAVTAAKAGARRVVAVDLDEAALEVARRNGKLNRVKIDFLHADLFNYLRQLKDRFDVVVLDPAKQASAPEDLPRARRNYHDMNALAMKAARPGGILVSCSCTGLVPEPEFLEILRAASRTAGRVLQTFRISGAGPDHPVSSLFPEGRYLKVAYSRVL